MDNYYVQPPLAGDESPPAHTRNPSTFRPPGTPQQSQVTQSRRQQRIRQPPWLPVVILDLHSRQFEEFAAAKAPKLEYSLIYRSVVETLGYPVIPLPQPIPPLIVPDGLVTPTALTRILIRCRRLAIPPTLVSIYIIEDPHPHYYEDLILGRGFFELSDAQNPYVDANAGLGPGPFGGSTLSPSFSEPTICTGVSTQESESMVPSVPSLTRHESYGLVPLTESPTSSGTVSSLHTVSFSTAPAEVLTNHPMLFPTFESPCQVPYYGPWNSQETPGVSFTSDSSYDPYQT